MYNLNVRKRSLALEEERVGAVGEELAAKAARLDTHESELREQTWTYKRSCKIKVNIMLENIYLHHNMIM